VRRDRGPARTSCHDRATPLADTTRSALDGTTEHGRGRQYPA